MGLLAPTATPRRRSTRLKARTSTPYWISRPRIWRWRASTRPSPPGNLKHAAADLPLAQAKETFMAIIKTERHGAIAVLILDRPETMNALGALGDGADIAAACAEITADPAVRCAILTGSGNSLYACKYERGKGGDGVSP